MSPDELQRFGSEIDALRKTVYADLGERDAHYIRNVLKAVRFTELTGRGLLLLGVFLPTAALTACWVAGIVLLALSKILDNMELGHNVMHGQFNWMGDPRFNGKTFEWDIAGTADNWRYTHNFRHHTYTNVHGLDDDIGYGVLRLFPEQAWSPWRLGQPVYALLFALMFQWGVAIQNLRLGRLFQGRLAARKVTREFAPVGRKMRHQLLKDYLFAPLLAGPGFLVVLMGNLVANGIRNLWTFTVIFCGHFTTDVETFSKNVIRNESRAHWYLRQIKGSSNLSGGFWLHVLTGNLSHQIEHHLFPDLPANRYAEMAPKVRDICARYGVHYNTGSMARQFTQVIWRIIRHSFPSTPSNKLAPTLQAK